MPTLAYAGTVYIVMAYFGMGLRRYGLYSYGLYSYGMCACRHGRSAFEQLGVLLLERANHHRKRLHIEHAGAWTHA